MKVRDVIRLVESDIGSMAATIPIHRARPALLNVIAGTRPAMTRCVDSQRESSLGPRLRGDEIDQLSRNERSFRDRLGCFNFRSAFASI